MNKTDPNLNDPQQRVLQVILILAGRELRGVPNAELARAIKTTESRMVSDLRNLEAAGFVERLPSIDGRPGNWRLSPRIVRIARAVDDGLKAIELQLEQTRQRYEQKAESTH